MHVYTHTNKWGVERKNTVQICGLKVTISKSYTISYKNAIVAYTPV